MKKDFITLMKEVRIVIHPAFIKLKNIIEFDKLDDLRKQIITEAGWTDEEFHKAVGKHFMDFSSEDPEQWIIRHDPERATIIYPNASEGKSS